MRHVLGCTRLAAVVLMTGAFPGPLIAATTTIDFETPALGGPSQTINPFVASGVTFTAIGQASCFPVVGLVRESVINSCAIGSNQVLSPGYFQVSPDTGEPIRASFPPPPAQPVTVVAVDALTDPGVVFGVSLLLYDSAGILIGGSYAEAGTPDCDGGLTRVSLVAQAPQPVAHAVIEGQPSPYVSCEACGCCEYCWPLLIDDFTFGDCLDTLPPVLTLSLSPAVLWPPNHGLVGVHATIEATDDCDDAPQVTLVSITSDEPDAGTGAEDLPDDIQDAEPGEPDLDLALRAERAEQGEGRTYTVCYRALDASGNTTDTCATVAVPHDQRGRATRPRPRTPMFDSAPLPTATPRTHSR